MTTLSPLQCQCARVLLKWSQKELAERCGMNTQTICLFETEKSTPTKRTLETITTVLENAGVEFLPNNGIQRRSREIQVLKGQQGFREMMNMVYETARDVGGEICILNGTPERYIKWLGADWYQMHAQRMITIKDNFDFRVVAVKPGEELAKAFAEYKWIEPFNFHDNSIYIFGNNVAIICFDPNQVTIELFNRPRLANTLRVAFNFVWQSV